MFAEVFQRRFKHEVRRCIGACWRLGTLIDGKAFECLRIEQQ